MTCSPVARAHRGTVADDAGDAGVGTIARSRDRKIAPRERRRAMRGRARGVARRGVVVVVACALARGRTSDGARGRAMVTTMGRKSGHRDDRGRRLASTSDATPIRAYGAGLVNAHGEGHEFYLSTTMAGGQVFDLLVDTGSPLTYLACWPASPEFVHYCGVHEHPYYDARVSDDFRFLNATTNAEDDAYCRRASSWFILDDESGACGFEIPYMDNSTAIGVMVEDVMTVGDELAGAKMIFGFGCLVEANGKADRHDGMAGFGRGETTFHTQLARTGVIDADVFGFCSEGAGTNTAMLSLGRYDFGRDLSPLSWTRMLGDDDLAVRTMSWKLGAKIIAGSTNVYTVLDSGTTLVVLPPVMYGNFMKELLDRIVDLNATYSDVHVFDSFSTFCFHSESGALTNEIIRDALPKLTITYDPDIALVLPPENYLFSGWIVPREHCIGIMEGAEGQIILGQQTLRNTFVEYDLENERIGLAVTHCENLREKHAPDGPTRDPWRFVAVVFILLFSTSVVGTAVLVAWHHKRRAGKEFKWRVLDDAELLDPEIELSDVARA